MTKRIFYKASFFIFLISIAITSASQSGVRVKASVDKNKILIGEHILLQLEADIPENEAIRFFSIDSLAHFEFLAIEKIDTSNTSNGTVLLQQIRLTSFDSGHWVIPPFVLDEKIVTDSIPIDVGFTSPFDPNQEYHDVKDVIDVNVEEKEQWWWWYAVAGGLILLILLIYFLTKKKVPKAVVVAPVNAYEEAMQDLEKLQNNKPAAKQYYSALVDIFRLYVARKKGISSLQKTTDDLVVQLRSLNMKKDGFDKLAQALRLSDFVKFAKYQPEATDDISSLKTIRESIMDIEQSELDLSQKGG